MQRRSVIVLDSCPIKATSTVELMPRLIIELANAGRIEWNVTTWTPARAAPVRSRAWSRCDA
jgi:hypothetical protein